MTNLKNIRKRGTYSMFKGLLESIGPQQDVHKTLEEVHQLLNDHSAYGSCRASEKAHESIDVLYADLIPYAELPMHINDKDPLIQEVVKERLLKETPK